MNGHCAKCGREGPVKRARTPSFSGKTREVWICVGPCDNAQGRRETLRANSIGDSVRRVSRDPRLREER